MLLEQETQGRLGTTREVGFEIKNKWAGSKTTVIVLWSCLRADEEQNENFDCAYKDIFNLKMAVDDSWKLENIP